MNPLALAARIAKALADLADLAVDMVRGKYACLWRCGERFNSPVLRDAHHYTNHAGDPAPGTSKGCVRNG